MIMDNSLLHRLGFSESDFDRKVFLFPDNESLSNKIGEVYYYGKIENVKTRFYWIHADNILPEELKTIHKRIWNENKTDLLFLENADTVNIKYISASPKQDAPDIDTLCTDVDDCVLLNKISKEHITTGAFWIEYNEALERVKKQRQTVDDALVASLSVLRNRLGDIYKTI
jgi:hypothetical protein